jgi:DNA-3-methyladenine glycosylase II
MAELIAAYPRDILLNRQDPFYTLARAVVGQQISIKAADVLWQRLETLLETFSPSHYLEVEQENLRQIGLSRQKISYIAHIAEAFTQGVLVPEGWETMADEAIARQLKSIKGVGTWTAEMFLIFHLHRPNILPLSDLGLVKAINCHYGRGKTLSKPEMLELSGLWQPYCTVATWYLWRSLDPVVVQY